jgi:hypothetical protein
MPAESGQQDVVGYIFPTPGLLAGVEPHVPAALSARTGAWCFDTMTAVTEGTWTAARGAVDAALTAADLVLDGALAAYRVCRPPGHHVTRSSFGGSCYLNNAAVTAQYLRDRTKTRVALLDIDAHHGNGAQAIFWERDDVLTGSVHVDPGAGWFPHFLGFADEVGVANLNSPVASRVGRCDLARGGGPSHGDGRRARGRGDSSSHWASTGGGRSERAPRRHRVRVRGGGTTARATRAADGLRPGGRLRARDDWPARPRDARGFRVRAVTLARPVLLYDAG